MAYGYIGKILVADLTSGTVTVDEHDDAWYRKYMGGAAMAKDYILGGVPPKADPLGPENVLVFAGGPLTGTAISGQSRMSVNCKSPLSGLIGDAQVGGFLPAELMMAGIDAVVLKRKSRFPSTSGSRTGSTSCAMPPNTGAWAPARSRTPSRLSLETVSCKRGHRVALKSIRSC